MTAQVTTQNSKRPIAAMPKLPTITITFDSLADPTIEIENWTGGVPMGFVERAGQLVLRAVQQEVSRQRVQRRIAEAVPQDAEE